MLCVALINSGGRDTSSQVAPQQLPFCWIVYLSQGRSPALLGLPRQASQYTLMSACYWPLSDKRTWAGQKTCFARSHLICENMSLHPNFRRTMLLQAGQNFLICWEAWRRLLQTLDRLSNALLLFCCPWGDLNHLPWVMFAWHTHLCSAVRQHIHLWEALMISFSVFDSWPWILIKFVLLWCILAFLITAYFCYSFRSIFLLAMGTRDIIPSRS